MTLHVCSSVRGRSLLNLLHLRLSDTLGHQRPIAVRLAGHEDGLCATRGGRSSAIGMVVPTQKQFDQKLGPSADNMMLAS